MCARTLLTHARSCVYRYPELDLVATLRGGTERSYAALAFSRAALHSDAASATGAGSSTGSTGSTGRTGSGGSGGGSRLASVGCAPDFTLTLWDWAAGAALLRCKAFSQDVYGVGFCPHSPGRLVSCGTGHIRFWSMASTFTGLKLQARARVCARACG
jgi:WD40 repeat protein